MAQINEKHGELYVIQGQNDYGQWQSDSLGDADACVFESFEAAMAAIEGLVALGGDRRCLLSRPARQ